MRRPHEPKLDFQTVKKQVMHIIACFLGTLATTFLTSALARMRFQASSDIQHAFGFA